MIVIKDFIKYIFFDSLENTSDILTSLIFPCDIRKNIEMVPLPASLSWLCVQVDSGREEETLIFRYFPQPQFTILAPPL